MTTVEHGAELARAGANITSRRQALLFLAKRYPLGAAGAVIMLLFVFTAVFASFSGALWEHVGRDKQIGSSVPARE